MKREQLQRRYCGWRIVVLLAILSLMAGRLSITLAQSGTMNKPGEGAPSDTIKPSVEESIEDAYDSMEILSEAMLIIHRSYVKDIGYKDIVRGALDGMLRALDEHSGFLKPEAYTDIQDDTAGEFSGIGAHIGVKDGFLTVIAPIEDTPAYKAGLMSGDRIIEIDSVKTQGIAIRDAVDRLRGEKGTKVTLTIGRAHEEEPFKVEIIRAKIEVPSIKGARLLDGGVGYVRLTQFAAPTADSLQAALTNLIGRGMNALVLDLRSNPGGLLSSAAAVSQKFLKEGDLVVTVKGRDPARGDQIVQRASGDYHYVDIPMAILVNRYSASASEIVAGALQDNKRAVLVGETTFGKGSVQTLVQLKSDPKSALRLTTALYYTPSGRLIHEKGIEPDVPVAVSMEEWQRVQIRRAHVEDPNSFTQEDKTPFEDVVDVQLQRAVDLLHALKVYRASSSASRSNQ